MIVLISEIIMEQLEIKSLNLLIEKKFYLNLLSIDLKKNL